MPMFVLGREAPERTLRIRTIKEWARQALSLEEDAVVMATELRCTEPGCAPRETVIAVVGTSGRNLQQFKIHKGLDELTYDDIERGAAAMLRGETHQHDRQLR